MSDKPINNQNLIATRYGFITYVELVNKLDKLEILEQENARLREVIKEAIEIIEPLEVTYVFVDDKYNDRFTSRTWIEKSKKALEKANEIYNNN